MRILKYLFAVIAVLGIGFYLVGVLVPRFTYTNEVQINASPAEVWAVFTDEARTSQWMAGFKGFENVRGNELEVGSQWRMKLVQNGEEFEVLQTITQVSADEQFSFTLDADVMVAKVDITLQPVDQGTRFLALSEVQGKSAAWRSLLWMAKSNMQSQGQTNYLALKAVVENN